MKSLLITYGSQYGYTEQYARWAEQQLEGQYAVQLLPLDALTERAVADADVLVAGLSDYGGFLTGAQELKKYEQELRSKPYALFTVSFSGLAGASQQKLDALLAKNLGESLVQDALGTYHLRGGLDHTRLSFKHKTVMVGIRSAIAALPRKSEANQQMLDSFAHKTVDYSSEEQIAPLVQAVAALA
ncbi:flavodoxin domain-containing protein [Rothia nasimurium]|uniref:flavodoxin domain-containing protein n=1 Tax=Rothia nasimurium TaxID=85336 RepID=UPI001F2774BE|nr:flavodoxin domain-containing protein [Rothia nasimurium]